MRPADERQNQVARIIACVGWAAYAASYLLPVVDFPMSGPTRGWELVRELFSGSIASPLDAMGNVLGWSFLTNLLMAATPVALWRNPPRGLKLLLLLMPAATALNLYWLLEPSGLLPGYYAWVGSFALVSLALTVRAQSDRIGRYSDRHRLAV